MNRSLVSSRARFFKCMLKFPQGMGTSNINLTMDYIQEDDEYPAQVLDEEERKQFSLLVSGFI